MDIVSTVIGALLGMIGMAILAWVVWGKRVSDIGAIEAKLDERTQRRDELEKQLSVLQAENDELASKLGSAEVTVGTLQTRIDEIESAHAQRLKDLSEAKEEMSNQFKVLSDEALRKSADDLIKQADAVLKQYKEVAEGDDKTRRLEIEKLLDPMKEKLKALDEQNQLMERNRQGAYAGLMEQVKSLTEQQMGLQRETSRLTKALQDPGSAGQWGEMLLKQVVEMAGLDKNLSFEIQSTIQTEDGNQRPDMIVKLPGGRCLIIDSKAPMKQYLAGLENENESNRGVLFADHAKKLGEHAKVLGKRDYSKIESAPDFTIMFVPSESAFRVALENRPGLLEDAMAVNVVIATPSTLLALLRAVSYGWRQEKLAVEAKRIQKLGSELYDRFEKMMEHYTKLGKAINDSAKHYNATGASLQSRVVPTLKRFKELGIESSKEIPDTAAVETQAQPPSLPEFENPDLFEED